MKTLLGLMSSRKAPRSSKRRAIASALTSTLLYAAPIWHSAMTINRNVRRLQSIHRRVLIGVICGYRTISYEAVCVMATVPPIDLLVMERWLRFHGMGKRERLKLYNKNGRRDGTGLQLHHGLGKRCQISANGLIEDMARWVFILHK